jgi:hypothetical protein
MSVNLIPEHALPKSYYFEMEANAVENYANGKQIAPEFDRIFLLVTPITEESGKSLSWLPPPSSECELAEEPSR